MSTAAAFGVLGLIAGAYGAIFVLAHMNDKLRVRIERLEDRIK